MKPTNDVKKNYPKCLSLQLGENDIVNEKSLGFVPTKKYYTPFF
jgi:hypothetical protein